MPKGVAVRVRARACPCLSKTRQRSSVVEHPIRNRAVVGSIPTAGSDFRPNEGHTSRHQTAPQGPFAFPGTFGDDRISDRLEELRAGRMIGPG